MKQTTNNDKQKRKTTKRKTTIRNDSHNFGRVWGCLERFFFFWMFLGVFILSLRGSFCFLLVSFSCVFSFFFLLVSASLYFFSLISLPMPFFLDWFTNREEKLYEACRGGRTEEVRNLLNSNPNIDRKTKVCLFCVVFFLVLLHVFRLEFLCILSFPPFPFSLGRNSPLCCLSEWPW